MKVFYLVLTCAVIVTIVYGIGPSRILFNMFFLWWVPFLIVIGGVLLWFKLSPNVGRDTKNTRDRED